MTVANTAVGTITIRGMQLDPEVRFHYIAVFLFILSTDAFYFTCYLPVSVYITPLAKGNLFRHRNQCVLRRLLRRGYFLLTRFKITTKYSCELSSVV